MRSSTWRRGLGNVRSFMGNSLGGLTGGSNLASCAVAGTLAYFLWVKPAQDLKREQQAFMVFSFWVGFRQRHPQDTGLIYTRKRETKESDT